MLAWNNIYALSPLLRETVNFFFPRIQMFMEKPPDSKKNKSVSHQGPVVKCFLLILIRVFVFFITTAKKLSSFQYQSLQNWPFPQSQLSNSKEWGELSIIDKHKKESETNHLDLTLQTEIVLLKGECAYSQQKSNTLVIGVSKKDFGVAEQSFCTCSC